MQKMKQVNGLRDTEKRMGDLLVDTGMITQNQLDTAIGIQQSTGEKLEAVFLEKGWISEQDMLEVLEFQLGIPYVDLTRYWLDPKATSLINETLAKRYMMIPIRSENNTLHVAMSDPLNIFAIGDLELITKMEIIPMMATTADISRTIDRVYSAGKTQKIAEQFQIESNNIKIATNKMKEGETEDITDSPIVKFVDTVFHQAISRGASDIHIEPSETYIRIRLRIDGQMTELLRTDISAMNAITARIKILSNLDISERRLPQDGRIAMIKDEQELDLRISVLPTIHGEKVVIRILYRTGMRLAINQLGFYPTDEAKVRALLKVPNGIILVTGPTGSGKSTTLATALREINDPSINIITVEDPVENMIEGISQVAVNVRAGLTFANALRSILRQDPDVIMVGEMRDLETSEIAIRSAITGHLVMSTLHTNDATSSINRLIDMGSQPYMIGSSVRGVIAQRLVRRICKNCKEIYIITMEEHHLTQIPLDATLYIGKGCQSCNQSGYEGRFAVHEVFVIDMHMQDFISKNKQTSEELRKKAIKAGMRTLQENTRWNVLEGNTTVHEMLRVTYEL
ncbi:MAG TPA: Flp pilus assembly complex ATPase component TadA [Epulopiscium sp.]|nr:Flp pilus assembly complex ATPase component TadA [Candidatus Epulonipiscium sp.]